MKSITKCIQSCIVGGAVATLLLPGMALAEKNPQYDPTALDTDLVYICEELSITATSTTATLKGRCNSNVKDPKIEGAYVALYDEISLDSDISDACYKWVELHFLSDRVDIAAGCSHPIETHTRNGVVLKNTYESRGKLDDMVGWNSETYQFFMKKTGASGAVAPSNDSMGDG